MGCSASHSAPTQFTTTDTSSSTRKDDSHHFVSLTSTTYGSFTRADTVRESPASSPDSVINTLELMEGLDDGEEFEVLRVHSNHNIDHVNQLNCNNAIGKLSDGTDYVSFGLGGPYEMVEYPDMKKPQSLLSKQDNKTLSPKHATVSYTKILEPPALTSSKPDNKELSSKHTTLSYIKTPETPVLSSKPDNKALSSKHKTHTITKTLENPVSASKPDNKALSSKHTSFLYTKTPALPSKPDNKALGSKPTTLSTIKFPEPPAFPSTPDNKTFSSKDTTLSNTKTPEALSLCLPGCEDRIVLYYTSLRGIRKTYEDCCEIRLILQGFRVFVDERDISLDSSYRDELKSVFNGKGFSLPQVFIKGKHVGGADEVKRLHEDGKLFGLMKGFRVMDSGRVCNNCGDVRFMPCTKCNGSRKVFMEGVWRPVKCPKCNENGLIRCVSCS
ncbi:uncharacterized protein LOC143608389 [Bidens hawaiensis]|uniref:uncharacterized protein LOC143608389 n=1 Tax=Bidens hawaiensis TaxID=980011 RepID=UPI00404B3021